jgi:hypothetical protein
MLFKLLPSLYPNVRIIIDHESHVLQDESIDLVVVSVLDGGCGSTWSTVCKDQLRHQKSRFKNSMVLLLSGEAWDLSDAGEVGADVVWSAHKTERHMPGDVPVVHLPNAVTSFAERSKGRGFRDMVGGGRGDGEAGRR